MRTYETVAVARDLVRNKIGPATISLSAQFAAAIPARRALLTATAGHPSDLTQMNLVQRVRG